MRISSACARFQRLITVVMARQRSRSWITIGATTGMRHGENTGRKHSSSNRHCKHTCAAASTCVLPHADVYPVTGKNTSTRCEEPQTGKELRKRSTLEGVKHQQLVGCQASAVSIHHCGSEFLTFAVRKCGRGHTPDFPQ